jgi:hypothetical protein
MNPDHAEVAEWDAAYVLGALSPSDRRRYEAHLEECPTCRAAIAEVAPTLGLLGRITPERADSMLTAGVPDGGPDPRRRDQLISLGRERPTASRSPRRRRGWLWSGGIVAAAGVAAAVVIAVTLVVSPAFRSIEVVALDPVVDVPWTATVELSDAAWGTRLEMECRYAGDAGGEGESAKSWPYALVVIDAEGTATQLSTWRARPGTTARLSAATALEAGDIAAIEIRALDDGRVLLRSELDGGPARG